MVSVLNCNSIEVTPTSNHTIVTNENRYIECRTLSPVLAAICDLRSRAPHLFIMLHLMLLLGRVYVYSIRSELTDRFIIHHIETIETICFNE